MDLRYLNLWMKDTPFSLDTLVSVTRILRREHFMSKLDDKSGYKNLLIHPRSRTLLGFQWAGYLFQANTLPFGWKNAAFCYHTLNAQVATYLRTYSVPILTYIDDRWVEEWRGSSNPDLPRPSQARAVIALYAVCQVTGRLGYFVSIHKLIFVPQRIITFLGLNVHSQKLAFSLPPAKRESFAALRENILDHQYVGVRSLQRFAGKCESFILAIPGARLFTSDVNRAISWGLRTGRAIPVIGRLVQEIEHWRLIDGWNTPLSWHQEKHRIISISTNASNYRWGAQFADQSVGDYWNPVEYAQPIVVKEAKALLLALQSFSSTIRNSRVDVQVDNMPVVKAWNNSGSRSERLIAILKDIFMLTFMYNIKLDLVYVPSSDNPLGIFRRLMPCSLVHVGCG